MTKRCISIFITLLIFLSIIPNFYVNAEDNNNLEQGTLQRNQDVSSAHLNSVAANSNICVAVGNNGVIKTSTDYTNWIGRNSGTFSNLKSIVWNGEKFVAVGDGGTILISSDGINWSKPQKTSGTIQTIINGLNTDMPYSLTQSLISVSYGNGKFIAVGYYGEIWTSSDGYNWEPVYNQSTTDLTSNNILGQNCWLNKIIYNGKSFLIIGYNYNVNKNFILTSTDGDTWRNVYTENGDSSSTANFTDLIWNGSKFIVVKNSNQILTSSDGQSWVNNTSNLDNGNKKIVYTGNEYIILTNSMNKNYYVSKDLVNWNDSFPFGDPAKSLNQDCHYNDIISNNGNYIAVGEQGYISVFGSNLNNLTQTGVSNADLTSGCYNGNKYVITSYQNQILTSTDNKSWQAVHVTGSYMDVIWSNGKYLAVGSHKIAISVDGINWTENSINNDLQKITYGNGIYIAVGYNGAIATSADGANWTSQTSKVTEKLNSITYNGSFFVAVGVNGAILKSKDGITWNKFTVPSSQKLHPDTQYNFNDVMWDGSEFIAVGDIIITSTDGENWTSRSLNGDSNDGLDLNSITYNNGYYVSVGYPGNIIISTDGLNWHYLDNQSSISNSSLNFKHILGDGNNFMLLSSNGGIFNFNINVTAKEGIDSSWQNSYDITKFPMYGMAVNSSNRLVSVGEYGTIKTSTDGSNWTIVNSGTKNRLNNVKMFNNEFFAVGNNGVLLYSDDGLTWTKININTNSDLYDISYNGSVFVAVGTNGVTISSTNGKKWGINTSGSVRYINLKSVVYFKGQFYTVGTDNFYGRMFTSKDGVNWVDTMGLVSNTFNNIACNDNTLVVSGNWSTGLASNDGVNWKNINTTCNVNGKVFWTGKYFITNGNNQLSYSTDGYNWNSSPESNWSFSFISSIVNYKNKILGVSNINGTFGFSDNGTNWNEDPFMIPAQELSDVVWGDGKFIAVGNKGTIVKSDNGKNWITANSNFDSGILSIEWNGDVYVAGAVYGNILTSKYGNKWTTIQLPSLKNPGTTWVNSVKWISDRFIAITNHGEIYTSKNALQWNKVYDANQNIDEQSITFNNNKIIITGRVSPNTIVLTSQDGITWTQNTINEAISTTVWSGNFFLSATDDGKILKSNDGINWTKIFQSSYDFNSPLKLYWNGQQFILLNGPNEITSTDGLNWITQTIDNAYLESTGLSWNGSKYLAVGGMGSLTAASKQVYSDPRPAYIKIKGQSYFALTGKDSTYNFNTDLFDQFGKTMSNKNIQWSVNTDLPGVKIDSQSGQLFIPANSTKGTAVINAKVSGTVHTLASKTIYIGQDPLVKLNNSSLLLNQGDTANLTASLSTGNSSSAKFSWESSDPTVAAVDDNGKINAVKPGKITITAVNQEDGSEADCDVEILSKADFNKDGKTDITDLAQLAQNYNVKISDTTSPYNKYDLNGDKIIDLYDLVFLSKQLN